MSAFSAELIKLRRSLALPVVVGLPIVLVLASAATQLARGEAPQNGWSTLWTQTVVFAGLFPLAMGTAILGSLVWRSEHRGGNWNAVMGGPTSSLGVVAAKTAVVAGLTAIMQVLLVIAIVLMGKLAFGLPGMLPAKYLGIMAVMVLAAVPAAALHSALSMLFRSFAAPVAVSLIGAGASVVLVMISTTIGLASPYGILTRASQLGTGTFGDTGSVTGADIAGILIAAAVLTAALTAAATAVLERRDTRI